MAAFAAGGRVAISAVRKESRGTPGARGAGVFAKTFLPHAARSRINLYSCRTPQLARHSLGDGWAEASLIKMIIARAKAWKLGL